MLIDLTGRQPQWPAYARTLWNRCAEEGLELADHWTAPPVLGYDILREQIALLTDSDPSSIAVTTGARAAAGLLAPDGVHVVECPGFGALPALLNSLGRPVIRMRWEDVTTCNLDRLAAASRQLVTFWATTPCRNPDGATADLRLTAACSRLRDAGHRVAVNEVYRWFHPAAIFKRADFFIGSVSKLMGPGIRIGWLRSNQADLRWISQRNTAMPPTSSQYTLALFLKRGGFSLLKPTYIDLPNAAREAFIDSIERSDVPGEACGGMPRHGPFVLLRLADKQALEALRAAGLNGGRGHEFGCSASDLRLCFTDTSADSAREAAALVIDVITSRTSRNG